MAKSRLTVRQQHWLLHCYKWQPGPCFKVPVVTGNALVERGFLKEVHIALVKRPGYVLTARGERFAKTGEQ